jgi:hypothetical protein
MHLVERSPKGDPMADPDLTQKSNPLFAAIVATVGATTERKLTVRELALRLGASEDTTAQCIALHRYLRVHADDCTGNGVIGVPLPDDFVVPAAGDVIDETALGLTTPPNPG